MTPTSQPIEDHPSPPRRRVSFVAWLLPLLALLHHDFWWWMDDTLVFGVFPIGLAYHLLFSLAAAALWWAASRWAWPADWEAWADESEETP